MLGRYQVLKHLATGGMAEVLVARSRGIEGFERHVVVKRILGENAKNEHFVKMFIDEARLAAAIHHHNVVQVHDIGTERGEYFFTMEYVHGEDLRNILFHAASSGTRVPLEHVVTIIASAAAGLHHAHEMRAADRTPLGIVHRDVSPANILVGYDGGVKVADFGIAKAAMRTHETRSGVLKGKVAYMSPEQCLGETMDRRSDIFGLGIVLYELTTVRRLFKGTNDFITMSMISGATIPLPSTKWPEIPPMLETIIMKALARAPADRYQTANEMRAALEQFAKQANLTASTSALGEWLVQHLGERPLPWEVENLAPIVSLEVDFDGSASGVAAPPAEIPVAPDEIVNSPIARARSRVTKTPPIMAALAATPGSTDDDEVAALVGVNRASRRRALWIGGAAVATVAILAIAIAKLTAAGSPEPETAAPVEPAPAITSPPVVVPPPVIAPPVVAPPPPVVPPPVVPPPVVPPPVVPPPPIATGSAGHPQKPPKKPVDPAKKKWDPNALFPK